MIIDEIRRMPRIEIDLMLRETVHNDPFYARITEQFLREARARHRRFPLIRALEFGVALTIVPDDFERYFIRLEGSARRNYRKAQKAGCEFRRIDCNQHLDEIAAIRASAPVRQGRMPEALVSGSVSPCRNPPSRSAYHGYPYFGVFRDGRLCAYAGCMIAGEVCMIEHIFGHADEQSLGVTPMLVIGIMQHIISKHPAVRYFGYGTWFGGARQLQRFKRKLGFRPHRVKWYAGREHPEHAVRQLVFRKVTDRLPEAVVSDEMSFVCAASAYEVLRHRIAVRQRCGIGGLLKTVLKCATPGRAFFFVMQAGAIIHSGWISFGFCRYYAVDEQAVVIGPVWTAPEARGKGAATFALESVMRELYRRSRAVVYVDTSEDNAAMRRVIEKCGFGDPVGRLGRRA